MSTILIQATIYQDCYNNLLSGFHICTLLLDWPTSVLVRQYSLSIAEIGCLVGCLVGLFVYSFIYKALLNFPSLSFHQTYSQIPNTFHFLEFCTQSDFLFTSTDSPCTNLSFTHCMFTLCFSHLPTSFMLRILLQLFSLLFTLCLHLAGSSQSLEIILSTMSLATDICGHPEQPSHIIFY